MKFDTNFKTSKYMKIFLFVLLSIFRSQEVDDVFRIGLCTTCSSSFGFCTAPYIGHLLFQEGDDFEEFVKSIFPFSPTNPSEIEFVQFWDHEGYSNNGVRAVAIGTMLQLHPVNVIIGCGLSPVSIEASILSNAMETVMIDYAATSAKLSNEDQFYLRTTSPEGGQARALYDVLKYFDYQYVNLLLTSDAFGLTVRDVFWERGDIQFDMGLLAPIDPTTQTSPEDVDTTSLWDPIINRLLTNNNRVWVVCPSLDSADVIANHLNEKFRIFGSEYLMFFFCDTFRSFSNVLSQIPIGAVNINSPRIGAGYIGIFRSSNFKTNVTSATTNSSLFFNKFVNSLDGSYFPSWFSTQTQGDVGWSKWDFQAYPDNGRAILYMPEGFDAYITIRRALANLNNQGYRANLIRGKLLLDEMLEQRFEGAGGFVSFDDKHDLVASYHIVQIDTMGLPFSIGQWSSKSGLEWQYDLDDLVFVNGSSVPPSHRPLACPSGLFNDGFDNCLPCKVGTTSNLIGRLQSCPPCPPGSFSDSPGLSFCTPCPPGGYNFDYGSTSCEYCNSGFYQDEDGQTECTPCPAGEFQSLPGSSFCLPCPVGSFNSYLNATSCTACEDGSTTPLHGSSSIGSCLCPPGLYRPCSGLECLLSQTSGSLCITCSGGMICKGGVEDDACRTDFNISCMHAIPKPIRGYWSSKETGLHTAFKCRSDEVCPGGNLNVCSLHRTGKACGNCENDYHISGNSCRECNSITTTIFRIVPFVAVALVLTLVCYKVTNQALKTDMTSGQNIMATLGMMLTTFQVLSILSISGLPKRDPWPYLVDLARAAVLDLDYFGLGCALSTRSAAYFFRMFIPAAITIILASPIAAPIYYLVEFDKIVNTIGAVFQATFLSLAIAAFVPFQCYVQPNGDTSMVHFPDIGCKSVEHIVMFLIGLISVCIYVGGYVCLIVYICIIGPNSSVGSSPEFLAKCKFAFSRFKFDKYYWNLVLVFRGLFLSLAPVFSPDSSTVQAAFIVIILSISMVFTAYLLPWRNNFMNLNELLMLCVLVVATTSVPIFVRDGGSMELTQAQVDRMESAEGLVTWLIVALILYLSVIVLYYIRKIARIGDKFLSARQVRRRNEFASKWLQMIRQLTDYRQEQHERIFNKMPQTDIYLLNNALDAIVLNYGALSASMRKLAIEGTNDVSRARKRMSCLLVREVEAMEISNKQDFVDGEDTAIESKIGNAIGRMAKRASALVISSYEATDDALPVIPTTKSGARMSVVAPDHESSLIAPSEMAAAGGALPNAAGLGLSPQAYTALFDQFCNIEGLDAPYADDGEEELVEDTLDELDTDGKNNEINSDGIESVHSSNV